jgi:chitin disaccharide deacetylase
MQTRRLIVVADDFGIGPEVSRGIIELMRSGSVSGTVLLANSVHAETNVRRWHGAGRPGEMGWHPNLNLDAPILAPGQVPSLLSKQGKFASLGQLMFRLALGRINYREVVQEFDAQLRRFRDLIGRTPNLINGHKHIHVFPLIGAALMEVLERWNLRPYVRRVREPLTCLWKVRGARLKRTFLATLGGMAARRQEHAGFAGNDWLAGVTDPKWTADPEFFARWIGRVPGGVVELAVHPGYRDETLLGRDCTATDGQLERRVAELRLLSHPDFRRACRQAGFVIDRTNVGPINGWKGRVHAAA